MPYTVWGAFDQFRREIVDLDPEVTKQARNSRDYLFTQLSSLASDDSQFPCSTKEYIGFGSFARRTKIRPLDDIDFLLLLNGQNTQITSVWSTPYTVRLRITATAAPLSIFADEEGYINSTRILNRIRDRLKNLSSYSRSELKKNMQAVVLNLVSYEWSFDIVPALGVSDGANGTVFYIIPDGYGNWIKTDPRIDAENITTTNTYHSGQFLPVIRLLKYWNSRTHKPKLPSYYFETITILVFKQLPAITNIPTAIGSFFEYAPNHIYRSCPDPKNLGPDLDTNISSDVKRSVVQAMAQALEWAKYALMYERQKDDKNAIYWCGKVFGPEFPQYG